MLLDGPQAGHQLRARNVDHGGKREEEASGRKAAEMPAGSGGGGSSAGYWAILLIVLESVECRRSSLSSLELLPLFFSLERDD